MKVFGQIAAALLAPQATESVNVASTRWGDLNASASIFNDNQAMTSSGDSPRDNNVANKNIVAGVDLGGGSIKFALIEENSEKIIARHTIHHEGDVEPAAIVERIKNGIDVMISQVDGLSTHNLKAVGIGAPGKAADGIHVEGLANFPSWKGKIPISNMVSDKLGNVCPVNVCNDADAALAGESWIGAAKGSEDTVMFTLGTGVGFAAISGGHFIKGAAGTIEGGHYPLIPYGRQCACGQRGCMEVYCSGTAIVNRMKEDINNRKNKLPLYDDHVRKAARTELDIRDAEFLAREELENLDPEYLPLVDATTLTEDSTVADIFASEDRYAELLVVETVKYLAAGILTSMRMFDPKVVIVGGGVTKAGDKLLLPLREEIEFITWKHLPTEQEIKFAELGDDAGSVGAAAVAIGIGK